MDEAKRSSICDDITEKKISISEGERHDKRITRRVVSQTHPGRTGGSGRNGNVMVK
jgi:hypothetical protein